MDLEQVTLTQLRYAVAAERTRNFRLAAAQCHVSQSGFSMQLQKLEELLGVTLFDRSKKPVMVTTEGGPVLDQMRAILRDTERLGQIIAEEAEPAGRYRLGVIPTLSPTVLPLFLKELVATYPRLDLWIEELKTEEIIARLHADTLDAGLASTPLNVASLHETPLGRETMVAYLHAADPLLKRSTVTQASLEDRALWVMPEGHCFRSQVLSYCSAKQRPKSPGVHFESGSFETLIRLVDEGLGATVLPYLVAANLPAKKRRAQVRPLVRPSPVREIGLVVARVDLRRRATEAVVELIRSNLARALETAPPRASVLEPLPTASGSGLRGGDARH